MSLISFGLKAPRSKRKVASTLSAFAEPEPDEPAPALSEAQTLSESDRLQNEGNSAADAEKYSTALQLWNQAISLTPFRAQLHEQKAQVFLQLGRCWDAVQCATRATELDVTWADAFLTLGRSQLGLGEPELALKSMETALQLQPELEEAQNEIAEVRMLTLQHKQHPDATTKRIKVV
ncbi:hypothetical protein WJX79_009582 [Trebouxia sp. C0005]|nr:MAG: hypothetical protein FRX49_06995 [Trebouxia sp. A1-2]